MSRLAKYRLKLNSLQFRIFLVAFLLGMIPMVAMRYGILFNIKETEVSNKATEINTQAKILATQISNSNYLDRKSSVAMDAQVSQFANIYDGRVMLIDSSYRIVKDTFGINKGKIITSQEVVLAFRGDSNTHYDEEYQFLEITMPIYGTNTQSITGVLVVSVSTEAIFNLEDYYRSHADVLMLIATIVVFFTAVTMSGLLVVPLHRLKQALNQRKNGIADEELFIKGCTEVEEISDEINGLFSSMRALDESRQEFVSNVSHELKTPITSMKVLADSLLAQEDAPAELYREFMEDIAAEVERESKIISDLLSLVKMDKSAAKPDISLINMNELLEVILKRIQPIAEKANVELVLESFRPVTAEVDEVKISLAISNLVENAVKYNREGGFVRVTLNADHQYFYLTVEDSGIGIPEDSLQHVFERFYRVDKSHSREIGGTGLGLAITRNSIIMHRGAIKVHSEEGVGTTFSVRVPLNYIA